jgi:two-component system sensor histidine kinase VicK
MNFLEQPLFRALFNTAVPRIVLKANAPVFTILTYNEAYKTATNTVERNIAGLSLWDAFNPDNAGGNGGKILLEALTKASQSNQPVSMPPFHYDIPSADGSQMEPSWWQLEIIPIAGDDGKAAYLLITTHNITDNIANKRNSEQAQLRAKNLTEQLAATHEELVTSNEELASTNEELNSTIEELTQSQLSLQELNNSLETRVTNRTKDLSESEARFRSMIEQSPVAMLITRGKDMLFDIINQPMLDLIDRDASVIGKPYFEAIPELKGQRVIDNLLHTYRTGEAWTGIEVPITINRSNKPEQGYYNLSYKPLVENGQITGVLQSATDVTEQVNNRKRIQASEHRLHSMVMTTPIGMTVLRTTELIVEMANQRMLTIWNRQLDDVIGNRMIDIFPELDGQPFIDLLKSVIETGKPVAFSEMEATISTTDGQLKKYYVDFSYDPLFDADGHVDSLLATVLDITEQVEARKLLEQSEAEQQALNEELTATVEELAAINEEHAVTNEELAATNEDLHDSQQNLQRALKEIKHNEQKLEQILGQLPALVVVLSGPNQVVDFANNALLKFWRKTREQVIGKPVLSVFPELAGQPFPAQWRHVYNTGGLITHREKPVIFKNADDSDRLSYVDYYYQPLTNMEGNRTGVLATVMDVTDKVEARNELEISKNEQQALNEELTATNEELAGINEELSATIDELAQSRKELSSTLNVLAESEGRLRYMLSEAPVAIAVMTGRELIVESANKKILEVWGKTPAIIGKPLHIALPELQGQQFLQVLDDIFITGRPFYGNEVKALIEQNGVIEEIYSNFVYYPLKNNEGQTTSIMLVATIVTEQVKARQKLQRAEETLRFSIEAANVGTWFMDVATRHFVPSPRLKEMFGFYTDEEVSYEAITAQIPDEYHHKIKAAIEKAITQGQNYAMEHPVTGKHDGKKRWLRGLGKLYPDAEGNLSHFSGLVIDITEQKMDELRKNDFIGMVSHELKTPLTSITAIVQMLNAKAIKASDTFTAGALGKANTQVKKMANMINGFLNISRLESGKLVLNKQPFNLDDLLTDIVDETQLTVTSHTITLQLCGPVTVNADMDKIGSVISNLLSNAVKYSPKGKMIAVKCERIGNIAQISVKDDGIGIKPHDIEKLFERYYRVESNTTQHISGFGIGLYLSAEIIKSHNGLIWVESEHKVGSTFYFTLPVE